MCWCLCICLLTFSLNAFLYVRGLYVCLRGRCEKGRGEEFEGFCGGNGYVLIWSNYHRIGLVRYVIHGQTQTLLLCCFGCCNINIGNSSGGPFREWFGWWRLHFAFYGFAGDVRDCCVGLEARSEMHSFIRMFSANLRPSGK